MDEFYLTNKIAEPRFLIYIGMQFTGISKTVFS